MIMRPFTLIAGLLFVLSGALMFIVKHHSQLLDDQLTATNQATTHDEQSIRVLQAQWALEADPSRLAQLAARFTSLQPMAPGQLVTLASLNSALPAPGSPPPGGNPEDPAAAMPQLAAAAPGAAPDAAPASASKAAPAVEVAAATAKAGAAVPATVSAQPNPVHLAARIVPRHHAAPERLAETARQTERPRHAMGAAIYLADASAAGEARRNAGLGAPLGAQVMPVRALATQAPTPTPTPMDGGSMLGMAQGTP